MKKGECHIGTSGWSYPHWKESFYENRPRKEWFSFYTSRFSTVEINATFYGRMNQKTYDNWYKSSPAGFRFALKGNRYITHLRWLKEPRHFLENEMDHDLYLKEKLAVVLWQLPVSFGINLQRLEEFCRALNEIAPGCRHAVEFRHSSWMMPEIKELLANHRIALCISDSGSWPLWEETTTDLVYVRLHGQETYTSSYDQESLALWARKIRNWRQEGRGVYVYFNNDALGAAPRDAAVLQSLVKEE